MHSLLCSNETWFWHFKITIFTPTSLVITSQWIIVVEIYTLSWLDSVHNKTWAKKYNLHQWWPSVIDVWDPLPFSPLPSSPLSHILWDIITKNEGISAEIWDQFIGNINTLENGWSGCQIIPQPFLQFQLHYELVIANLYIRSNRCLVAYYPICWTTNQFDPLKGLA